MITLKQFTSKASSQTTRTTLSRVTLLQQQSRGLAAVPHMKPKTPSSPSSSSEKENQASTSGAPEPVQLNWRQELRDAKKLMNETVVPKAEKIVNEKLKPMAENLSKAIPHPSNDRSLFDGKKIPDEDVFGMGKPGEDPDHVKLDIKQELKDATQVLKEKTKPLAEKVSQAIPHSTSKEKKKKDLFDGQKIPNEDVFGMGEPGEDPDYVKLNLKQEFADAKETANVVAEKAKEKLHQRVDKQKKKDINDKEDSLLDSMRKVDERMYGPK